MVSHPSVYMLSSDGDSVPALSADECFLPLKIRAEMKALLTHELEELDDEVVGALSGSRTYSTVGSKKTWLIPHLSKFCSVAQRRLVHGAGFSIPSSTFREGLAGLFPLGLSCFGH